MFLKGEDPYFTCTAAGEWNPLVWPSTRASLLGLWARWAETDASSTGAMRKDLKDKDGMPRSHQKQTLLTQSSPTHLPQKLARQIRVALHTRFCRLGRDFYWVTLVLIIHCYAKCSASCLCLLYNVIRH